MTHGDFPESLRSLLRRDEDLRSRCLQASVAQGLFGSADTVELAGTHFSVLRRLGAGAMGVVYEVERAGHSGRLALKLLHRAGSEQAYRLKREFRTLSRLGHPNLVTLHELYADADGCAFTMELVRGSEFSAYVQPGGLLSLARLRDVLAQLADGLGFLHEQGVIHRDLKPSNLLIDAAGRAVLLDFGVALVGPELDVSGTERYMAPEQRSGRTVPGSDLYALGVMLERVLAPQPSAADPELAALLELSRRLRSEDPAARPSARELLVELRAGSPARLPLKSAGFVGRDVELARLRELALDNGRPRLCYVEGPSGQGKSALIAEFARQLEREGSAWTLIGRCCRRESVRYRALDPLIDALSDALLAADPALLQSLQVHVTAHLLELFPVLERVPSFARQKGEGATLADPRERRAAAVGALRALLGELARRVRLCLCIDDVHWLDAESLSMMRELLGAPEAPSLLWLCAGRPPAAAELEALTRALPVADVCRIELHELPPHDATALARALWPDRPELWDWAPQRSQGNPFVLGQLGQLALESERPGDELAFERMVELRLRALPERARELLALVALSNQPLSLEVLCDCAQASRADLEGALHMLEGQRYLRSTPSQPLCVEPYHDRIADFAQGLLPEASRPALHLRIAEALERKPDAVHAPALLFHYRRAGRPQQALHFGRLAAQRAEELLSFHEAASLFAECAELASVADERAELLRARADALVSAGRDHEAGMILHELSHAASGQKRFELVCGAADLFFRAGYRKDAMRLLDPWLRELGLAPRRTRAGQFGSFLLHRARSALPSWASRAREQAPERARQRIELCLLTASGLSRSEILQSLDYAARLVVCVQDGGTLEQRVRAMLIEALIVANVRPRSERAVALVERAQALSERVPDP
ncbi:MAG TPA: AAA family ATPase, partial [Polyangiales bacterium]|nr:AAA family ATPase [Polyangiales bacterium]